MRETLANQRYGHMLTTRHEVALVITYEIM